jgi:preprotein translocase subunit SecE
MATESAIKKGDDSSSKRQQPGALAQVSENALGMWGNFTSFLSDVRAEMKKVVTPTRKEVQATTTVVIVTVFVFGFYFWVTDTIFGRALQAVLHKLGAQ